MLEVLALENLLNGEREGDQPSSEALELLLARETARAASDWAEADRIRDLLDEAGWLVRDAESGPSLVRKQ